MPRRPKLKVMVASTIYNFEDQIRQICAVLSGYGYEVWNSSLGTLPVHPALSNEQNSVAAVGNCDVFLGIIRPFYGSGVIGPRSITHEECREAVRLRKPRWFLVHRDVTFARQLLKPYLYKDGKRTEFKVERTAVLDDSRVIDLYNDAIQNDIPPADRKGHWVQEFYRLDEALGYIDIQFRDAKKLRSICAEMNKP